MARVTGMTVLSRVAVGERADGQRVLGVARVGTDRSVVGRRRPESGAAAEPVLAAAGRGRRGNACRRADAGYARRVDPAARRRRGPDRGLGG